MFTAQQQTLPIASHSMLQGIVDANRDRPSDTPGQREARSRDIVDYVQGFAPRDPVELMLAGMVVTHAFLIHDAVRDLSRAEDDQLKKRAHSTIVALDRAMIGFLREFRIAGKRPLGQSEVEAPTQVEPTPVTSPAQIIAAAKTTEIAKPRPAPPRQMPVAEPPHRPTATSAAAMLAVLSPPTRPFMVPTDKATSPRPVAGHDDRP